MVNTANKPDENIFEGAISANPNFVTEFLNSNGSLEKITSVVVIYFDKRTYDIYRESTGKTGWSSRETRAFENYKPIKDANKYPFPPQLDNTRPIYQFRIKGINCSAYIEPTIDQINEFTSILEGPDGKI